MKRVTFHLNKATARGSVIFACGMNIEDRFSTKYVNQVTCGRCKQTNRYKYLASFKER